MSVSDLNVLLQVSELLGSLPDLSQDEGVRGEGAEPEKKSSDRAFHPEDELADLAINTGETEVLSDIFGLDLRREGGQYKLTPHDPNASLTHLLISPPPAAIPSPELRQRHQVGLSAGALRWLCTRQSPIVLFLYRSFSDGWLSQLFSNSNHLSLTTLVMYSSFPYCM